MSEPVSAREFSEFLTNLPQAQSAQKIAVAVSGGSDSMALCLLLRDWALGEGKQLTALTVDHGLRSGSASEVRQVARWLAERGVEHVALAWEGQKPAGNIQASARAARYALMDAWCTQRSVPCLMLAHHLEDQAETFLLRLGRGSGVYGLSGMEVSAKPSFPGAPWRLRPLLAVPKARLGATLEQWGQNWIEDPSNESLAFARVRARKLKGALVSIGLTPERLAETTRHLARVRSLLEAETDNLLATCAVFREGGYALVNTAALSRAHAEVGLRALARLVMAVRGADYPPRFARLERLWSRLGSGALGGGATLLGCRIKPVAVEEYDAVIFRETRGMGGPVEAEAGKPVIWDQRYHVRFETLGSSSGPIYLDALGGDGWRCIRKEVPGLVYPKVPAAAHQAALGLWDSQGLLAAPEYGYLRAGVEVAPGLRVVYLGAFRDAAFCAPDKVVSGVK